MPGAIAAPAREGAVAVFAQARSARLDLDALRQSATRFFGAKIGLTVDKDYAAAEPDEDAARVVLSAEGAAGTRLCFGRRADGADVAAAEAAERAQGTYGMALLAQRCPTIWLVVPDAGPSDRVALTIAAIFASVMLGPILAGGEIFGVRTARAKLDAAASPYR